MLVAFLSAFTCSKVRVGGVGIDGIREGDVIAGVSRAPLPAGPLAQLDVDADLRFDGGLTDLDTDDGSVTDVPEPRLEQVVRQARAAG